MVKELNIFLFFLSSGFFFLMSLTYKGFIILIEFALILPLISWFPAPHIMQKMINGMTVSRWACINFSRCVQESVARGFCNELAQMCQVSGMVVFCLFHSACLKIEQYYLSRA